jgi:hypothetical protein
MAIVITETNVKACRNAIDSIERVRTALDAMLLNYPVQCTIEGIGFWMLNNVTEVDALLDELEAGLCSYELTQDKARFLCEHGDHIGNDVAAFPVPHAIGVKDGRKLCERHLSP